MPWTAVNLSPLPICSRLLKIVVTVLYPDFVVLSISWLSLDESEILEFPFFWSICLDCDCREILTLQGPAPICIIGASFDRFQYTRPRFVVVHCPNSYFQNKEAFALQHSCRRSSSYTFVVWIPPCYDNRTSRGIGRVDNHLTERSEWQSAVESA